MRISNQGLVAAVVLSLCSGAALAAEAVNPDKLPRIECSALRYSEDFLQKYPTAPAACLEARVYKGETYMKVKAKVYVRAVTVWVPQSMFDAQAAAAGH